MIQTVVPVFCAGFGNYFWQRVYPSQLGGAVPAVVEFEGGDFFNIGAENADENRDLVTAAFGFRSRLTDSVDAGVAYEIPLTNDEDSLFEERVTVDVVWTF